MKKFILQIKSDAIPLDGINKTVWADDDYEEIEIDIQEEELPIDMRLSLLKQNLADTDYIIIKIAEGVASKEEYAYILEQRKMWRAEINDLEDILSTNRENYNEI